MRKGMVVAFVGLALAGTVAAEEKGGKAKGKAEAPPMPAMPPEVKKTTDAFVGKWDMDSSVTMPGQQPTKFKGKMDCRKIANGNGVDCSTDARSANMPPIVEQCLLAADPEGTGVHLMCVTSMGEVHDHVGKWTDDKSLTFTPVKATMGGKPMTEEIVMTLPDPKTLKLTSTVTMGDGSKMVFESTATKKQ